MSWHEINDGLGCTSGYKLKTLCIEVWLDLVEKDKNTKIDTNTCWNQTEFSLQHLWRLQLIIEKIHAILQYIKCSLDFRTTVFDYTFAFNKNQFWNAFKNRTLAQEAGKLLITCIASWISSW